MIKKPMVAKLALWLAILALWVAMFAVARSSEPLTCPPGEFKVCQTIEGKFVCKCFK